MITINNIYNIKDTVFYVEKDKIKSGKITAIICIDTDFLNYEVNNEEYWYSKDELAITPEKALENYITDCRLKEMCNIGKKYNKLEKEIYEDWCKKLN